MKKILNYEKQNHQALNLMNEAEKRLKRDGLIGIGVAAGAAAVGELDLYEGKYYETYRNNVFRCSSYDRTSNSPCKEKINANIPILDLFKLVQIGFFFFKFYYWVINHFSIFPVFLTPNKF